MNYVVSALFVVVGLINFMPIVGVLSAEQLERLYHLPALNADMELLMRHRAVLFGIVGSLIVAAALAPSLRFLATLAGLVSMISFIVLVFSTNSDNPNLVRIAWIDVAASVMLILAFAVHLGTADS